jgi:predicted RNase H-like HicB family nuclease
MEYQIFVKNQSDKHFTASVMGMPSIAVDGDTEAEAIANVKTALESQLATGKVVTISLQEPIEMDVKPKTSSLPVMPSQNPWIEFAGIFKDDPDFANIARSIRAERTVKEDEILA